MTKESQIIVQRSLALVNVGFNPDFKFHTSNVISRKSVKKQHFQACLSLSHYFLLVKKTKESRNKNTIQYPLRLVNINAS